MPLFDPVLRSDRTDVECNFGRPRRRLVPVETARDARKAASRTELTWGIPWRLSYPPDRSDGAEPIRAAVRAIIG